MVNSTDPTKFELLSRQIKLQQRMAWDLETGIPWQLGIDTGKYFLPLDDANIAFPGASAEQRLALSQFMGLVVNSTISEMEDALPKLKATAWSNVLREYPVNPEMIELGEIFFDEEAKHARAFGRYLETFCHATGVDRKDLDDLLPKAFGSYFQKAVTANALAGGHAFWWVVASVEEVSIAIYEQIYRHRAHIDPLYYDLHRRHLEEEARHANYAFLMLNVINRRPQSMRRLLHKKFDFLLSQLVGAPWVITELQKFLQVKHLKGVHPFFDVLASCIPLYEALSKRELVQRLFVAAPYVSWLLNPSWRTEHNAMARRHGAFVPSFPLVESSKIAAG